MSAALPTLGAGLRLAGFAALTAAAGYGLAILRGRDPGAGARLEAGFLRWARIAFLLLVAALAVALGAGHSPASARSEDIWGLFTWLVCFAMLHTHRVKAYKGRRTAAVGVLGWTLAALAWLATR
jgi:hypothetical protein